jgi:hypothetical protein
MEDIELHETKKSIAEIESEAEMEEDHTDSGHFNYRKETTNSTDAMKATLELDDNDAVTLESEASEVRWSPRKEESALGVQSTLERIKTDPSGKELEDCREVLWASGFLLSANCMITSVEIARVCS